MSFISLKHALSPSDPNHTSRRRDSFDSLMLEQPESPTASRTNQQVFDHYLYRLQTEIHTILSRQAECEERARAVEKDCTERLISLENELNVWKRAYADQVRNKQKLDEYEQMYKQAEKRVVCIIDGDGTIFLPELLALGQEGGRIAAQQLTEAVQRRLVSASALPLSAYIFYNKRGLIDTLSRAGPEYSSAREGFDDFVIGFNQSSQRFLMVNVGSGKEAADAKIKVYLEDNVRSIETHKVLFGGCHDNGYYHTLNDLITSGFREKIILLPGYTEVASEIRKLQFETLIVPNLFLPDKIVLVSNSVGGVNARNNLNNPHLAINMKTFQNQNQNEYTGVSLNSPVSGLTTEPYRDAVRVSTPAESRTSNNNDNSNNENVRTPLVIANHIVDRSPKFNMNNSSSPIPRDKSPLNGNGNGNGISYRSVLQAGSSGSSANLKSPTSFKSSNDSPNGNYSPNVITSPSRRVLGKVKRINRNLPLSKHEPPPCTLYYLAKNGCTNENCKFGHDYVLEDDDYETLDAVAKKIPCAALNRDEQCVFGEDCCYGHICPLSPKCRFFKEGRCKFVGSDMHPEA